MKEQEKEMLRKISSMRIEAQSMLRLISNLQNAGKNISNRDIDKWLDRIMYLDKLEEELKKRNIN